MKIKLVCPFLILSLAFSTVYLGCANNNHSDTGKPKTAGIKGHVTKAYEEYFGNPKPVYPNTTYYVVFYPYSAQEPFLSGKVKPIAKEAGLRKGLPELAVNKLLQTPPLNETLLIRLINPETRLIGLTVDKGTAMLNFSKEILDSQVGSWGEQAIIASLSHTLSQFENIKKTSIAIEGESKGTIDGRQIEQFLGHISLLDQPFSPEKELVVTEDQENALLTLKGFLHDAARDEVYQYLSKATKKDVGTEKEFKEEKKSDLHKVILSNHGSWVAPQIIETKFEKKQAKITVQGNRIIETENRENDQAIFTLVKENQKWKTDFTETSEIVPSEAQEEIITGPANISRDQLEQIQAIVDQGKQSWRLDPQLVLETEAGIFGFDGSNDAFTLIAKTDMGQLSGIGEALFEANHKNSIYQIFLTQPVKSGEKGIWTISMVKKKII